MTDITVYAENSMQLAEANEEIGRTLRDKRYEARQAAEETAIAITEAEAAGFQVTKLNAQRRRYERLQTYYDKLIQALNAGYAIIPNTFWGETIAVRTDATKPPRQGAMPTKALPAGNGRYVHPIPFDDAHQADDGKGGLKTIRYNTEIDEKAEFPMFAAKPQLMVMTREAMEQKIFDEIQIAGGRAQDPMVIGLVRHPARSYQFVSFVIGWWLDTRTL